MGYLPAFLKGFPLIGVASSSMPNRDSVGGSYLLLTPTLLMYFRVVFYQHVMVQVVRNRGSSYRQCMSYLHIYCVFFLVKKATITQCLGLGVVPSSLEVEVL